MSPQRGERERARERGRVEDREDLDKVRGDEHVYDLSKQAEGLDSEL